MNNNDTSNTSAQMEPPKYPGRVLQILEASYESRNGSRSHVIYALTDTGVILKHTRDGWVDMTPGSSVRVVGERTTPRSRETAEDEW